MTQKGRSKIIIGICPRLRHKNDNAYTLIGDPNFIDQYLYYFSPLNDELCLCNVERVSPVEITLTSYNGYEEYVAQTIIELIYVITRELFGDLNSIWQNGLTEFMGKSEAFYNNNAPKDEIKALVDQFLKKLINPMVKKQISGLMHIYPLEYLENAESNLITAKEHLEKRFLIRLFKPKLLSRICQHLDTIREGIMRYARLTDEYKTLTTEFENFFTIEDMSRVSYQETTQKINQLKSLVDSIINEYRTTNKLIKDTRKLVVN